MKTYTALFVLAFLFSYLSTPLLRWLLQRRGLLDTVFPHGPHQRRPVPRLGGVVIYFSLLLALSALFIPDNVVSGEFRYNFSTLFLIWGPATLVLLLGVADDIWGVNPWVKLSVQLAAALWLVLAGVSISRLSMPWGSLVVLGSLAIPVTLVWLVGVTNAFNLIDGLDGLAAGVAFLSASAIAVTAAMVDDKITVVLTVALAGALLGFLRHNFNPATIFLGDSGSLFIGFLLASAAIVWQQKATVAIAVVAPLVAFALPVTETAVSVLRRYLRGQPLFTSDRQHIHHRLVTLGLSPRRAVLVLYAASALAALGCILIARGHNFVTAMVLVIFMGACWIGLRRLSYPEFVAVGRAFNRQRGVARGLLEELAQRLRDAASLDDLRRRLEESAGALELDEAMLAFEARDWPAESSDRLWRLTIPVNGRARLCLGRSPGRPEAALSLEEVGRELRAALEESLARMEPEAAAASPWGPPARREA